MEGYCILLNHDKQVLMFGNEKKINKWIAFLLSSKKEDLEKLTFFDYEETEIMAFKHYSRMYPQYDIVGPWK